MQKITLFVMAFLCHLSSLLAQNCNGENFYTNKIELEAQLRDISGSGLELRGLSYGKWEEKEVIIHSKITIVIPTNLGCYDDLKVWGPNNEYNDVQPGDELELNLNKGENNVSFRFFTCTEHSLIFKEKVFFVNINDQANNEYNL